MGRHQLLACFFILSLSLLSGLTSCKEVNKTKKLKLAHGLNMEHPVHEAMVYLAKRVYEKSGGKLQVDIYPNAQLGSERENLELLQIGSLGMTKVSASVMESFAPKFKIFSLPYIFNDQEHLFQVLDGPIGKQMLTEGTKFWLRGLTYYDAGSRSFYSVKKPIETPSDLKGMKIRVQDSNTSINMVNALGGSATPISWGELYTALQQGVVDGAENNPPSFHLSRHYEVAKYYTLNEHTMVPDVLLISTIVWDELNPQEQQWLQEAADESAVLQRKLWDDAEKEALRIVAEAGVEIIYPEKQPFEDLVEPMYDSYRDEPHVYEMISIIKNSQSTAQDSTVF